MKKLLALSAISVLAFTNAFAGSPQSFDEAKAAAATAGKPLLLKAGTSWCTSCKAFDAAVETETEFSEAIRSDVVLFRFDAEQGEGIELAEKYDVVGYPTFIVANADGETMDRWVGFHKKEYGHTEFLTNLSDALEDPTTVAQKFERYRENPTEADARKLGDLRLQQGYPAEAVAYYARADQLNPESDTDYNLRSFGAMARGRWSQMYTTDQLAAQADVVYAADVSEEGMLEVLWTMQKVGQKTDSREVSLPYLQAFVERTENTENEKIAHKRSYFEADYALFIEKDAEKALAIKRANLPEGWEEDWAQLNNFAWWCFENEMNLAEAEVLARRGVDLAESGTNKALVLDTLAEICNSNNDCSHAVEYIRLAMENDPENEYYQNQLSRFEEILASSR